MGVIKLAEAAIAMLTLLSRFLPWKPGTPRTEKQRQNLQNKMHSWINGLRQAFDEILPEWPDFAPRKMGLPTQQAAFQTELVDTVLPYVRHNMSEASYIVAKTILKLQPENPFKEMTMKQIGNKAQSIRTGYYRTQCKYDTLKKRLAV